MEGSELFQMGEKGPFEFSGSLENSVCLLYNRCLLPATTKCEFCLMKFYTTRHCSLSFIASTAVRW